MGAMASAVARLEVDLARRGRGMAGGRDAARQAGAMRRGRRAQHGRRPLRNATLSGWR